MTNRTDNWIIIVSVLLLGTAGVLFAIGVSSYVVQLVEGLGILVIFGFAAYTGLSIRRILAVGTYRNQALGVALVAFAVVYFSGFFGGGIFALPPSENTLISNLEFYSQLFLPLITVFYWADASILAARRSNPLFRDLLRWSFVRIILWSLILAPLVFNVIVFGVYFAIAGINLGVATSNGPTTLPQIVIAIIFVVMPAALPIVATAVYLPLATRKAKNKTLRSHLKWFGIFAVLLALAIISVIISPYLQPVFYLACGYALYRSARALVPLYEFSPVEISSKVQPQPP